MSTDRTNAERQQRFRDRNRQARADAELLKRVQELTRETGQLTFPASLSREEWSDFIDREEERRTKRDATPGTPWDK